jgi:hypothetical protein
VDVARTWSTNDKYRDSLCVSSCICVRVWLTRHFTCDYRRNFVRSMGAGTGIIRS